MSDQPTVIGQPYDNSGYGGSSYGSGGSGASWGDSRSGTTRPTRRPLEWNPATDFGLLVLRFAVGGVFFTHGVQKVFGLWAGMGITGWTTQLREAGYTIPETLAWPTAIAEMVAGALLVLGFGTPLVAAGLLGIMINALLLRWPGGFEFDWPGAETEIVLAGGALALALTGAGRIALESGRTWNRRPAPWGVLCLIIGVAAALLVYFFLR